MKLENTRQSKSCREKDDVIASLNTELSNAKEWYRQLTLARDQLQVSAQRLISVTKKIKNRQIH